MRTGEYVAADDFICRGHCFIYLAGYLNKRPFSSPVKRHGADWHKGDLYAHYRLVALSESLGAENILGAFLAGVLVSLLSPNKELVQQLDSFGYGFLIPIFFVMAGVKLNIWSLFRIRKFYR